MMRKPRTRLLATTVVLLLGALLGPTGEAQQPGEPPPAQAQPVLSLELDEGAGAPRPPSAPKILWLDIKHVVSRPFHWDGKDFLALGAILAVAGGAFTLDDEVSAALYSDDSPTLGTTGEVLSALGDGRSLALTGGFLLYGAIAGDRKAREVGVDAIFAGVIGAGLVNTSLATVIGRERPNRNVGSRSFQPGFHTHPGYRSFPSGHVAHAFSVVSVIAASYDEPWVKVLAYGAGTVTAYGRMQKGKHFLSDVVVGAALGTAVGHTVVRFNRRLRHGEPEARKSARLMVVPLFERRAYGFSAAIQF